MKNLVWISFFGHCLVIFLAASASASVSATIATSAATPSRGVHGVREAPARSGTMTYSQGDLYIGATGTSASLSSNSSLFSGYTTSLFSGLRFGVGHVYVYLPQTPEANSSIFSCSITKDRFQIAVDHYPVWFSEPTAVSYFKLAYKGISLFSGWRLDLQVGKTDYEVPAVLDQDDYYDFSAKLGQTFDRVKIEIILSDTNRKEFATGKEFNDLGGMVIGKMVF